MPDRSVAPPIGQIQEIRIPRLSQTKLLNGIPLSYFNAGSQPVCKLEVIVNTGKWYENKPATSWLSFRMLQEGTRNLTAFEISEVLDETGSYFGTEPGMKFSSLNLYFLKSKAQQLIPLVANLLFDSSFPSKELDKQKQILIQNIKVDLKKTSVEASRLFRGKLFGNGHPYSSFAMPEHVEQITTSDINEFYQEKILQSDIRIIVSGLVDEEILKLIETHFGERAVNSLTSDIQYNAKPDLKKEFVQKANSTQTSIRMGKHCIHMDHPDYHKLYITNEILGGYFGSRLMQNIRETKGLTYGIYSHLNANRDVGYFAIGADANKELRDQVIEEVIKEVEILESDGVSEEELTTVKNYLQGEFLGEIDTPFKIASKFKAVYLNNLGYDFYEKYFETLNTINPLDVQEMVQKYLKTKDFVIVGVG